MSTKTLMKIGLALLAVSLLSLSPASAWTCDGTITLATEDTETNPGQITCGDYQDTWYSDDVNECLEETGNPSDLYHVWEFEDVPAGTQYLIWEGHRITGDGETFKFMPLYVDGSGTHGVIPNPAIIINKVFETQGGTKSAALATTTSVSDWYLDIVDMAGGSVDDTVYIDYLAICTETND